MNEEAIRIATGLRTDFKCESDTMVDFCNTVIKALEQQDALDKIRAEIEKLQKMCDKNDLNLLAQYSAFGMVLEIIDKYKVDKGDEQ